MDVAAIVDQYGDVLTAVAEEAIRGELEGVRWDPSPWDYPTPLRQLLASFVTLEDEGELLGCIGSLEPALPLVADVAVRARHAAFADPRFPPIDARVFERMTVTVSVLSPIEDLEVHNREELEAVVRPFVDGLVLESSWHRGTFLPSVWHKLPSIERFLDGLWLKAGIRLGTWPADLRVGRYTTATCRAVPPRAGPRPRTLGAATRPR